MKKTKIAIILPKEEYFSKEKSGALSIWTKEVFPLIRDQFDCLIFCRKSNNYLSDTIKVYPIHVETINWLESVFRFSSTLSFHIRTNLYPLIIAFVCKLKGYKLIHIHNRPTYSSAIKKVFKQSKIVLHMHNDHFLGVKEAQLEEQISLPTKIVSVSQYINNGIVHLVSKKEYFNASMFKTILNGVNFAEFDQDKELENEKIQLLFVGRLVPEKGVKELIQAFINDEKIHRNADLTIVGGVSFGDNSKTAYIEEIQYLAKPYHNIQFIGAVPHTEVKKRLFQSDIFIIPSIWNDPCPLSVLEGMASFNAVIGSNKGGIPELIGEAGVLINPVDLNEFSKKLEELISNKKSRNKLKIIARNRVENFFGWQRVANDFAAIYKEILS